MSAIQPSPSPHNNSNIIAPERISNIPAYAKDIDRPYVGDPWSRQPNEAPRAWEAFQLFRDMDSETRTIVAASKLYKDKFGLTQNDNHTQLYQWSSKHRWQERCAALDNYQDAAVIAKNRRRLIRAADKHAQQSADIQSVLMKPIDELRKRLDADPDAPDIFQTMDDAQLLKLAAVFGRDLPAQQESERKALASTSQTVVSPVAIQSKGILVRKMLQNKTLGSLMEAVAFSVEETVEADDSAT